MMASNGLVEQPALLTNNDDDDIDFDEGYQGNIQALIIKNQTPGATPVGSNDPRGIELNSSDNLRCYC